MNEIGILMTGFFLGMLFMWCCDDERLIDRCLLKRESLKLDEYEMLELQGKLLRLPAAIGDEIFFIFIDCPKDCKEEYCRDHEGSCENCPHRVPEIVSRDFRMSDFPNIDKIYATKKEAEAALKAYEQWKE